MGEWQDLRLEIEAFAAREHRSLSDLSEVLIEWHSNRLPLAVAVSPCCLALLAGLL
jgi:hypothetical protein